MENVESFSYLHNMNLDCENVMRIHIDSKEAYDLQELTNMLCSLSGLYNNFLIKNGYQVNKNTGKLLVQSVKEGSMIFDLIAPVLPIANDLYNVIKIFNPILEFGSYIKCFFNELKEGKQTTTKLDKKEYKYIQNTFGNLGSNSKQDIKVFNINNPTINIECINNDFLTSNAINSICEKEIKKIEENDRQDTEYEKQLLKLTIKNNDKIKGVISKIDNKEKQLIMPDDIKRIIINDNVNPFQKYYLVNLIVHYDNNKIIYYEIKDIIEQIDIDNEN